MASMDTVIIQNTPSALELADDFQFKTGAYDSSKQLSKRKLLSNVGAANNPCSG